MMVTIHQPDFLPWLGFFHRWQNCEKFIVLDDVQFIRRGWHHRDKVKFSTGVKWLTVPVMKKGKFEQLIRDVRLEEGMQWRKTHLNTIRAYYGKAPGFDQHFSALEDIYQQKDKFLVDMNVKMLRYIATTLGLDAPMLFASELGCDQTATRRLVELTARVGGTQYLTGTGSREYLEETLFREREIEVVWQQFTHPVYPQLHGAFVPGLSVLDYVMNVQPGESFLEADHA
ncbi:MAG: WbqC family protein [Proteobacteria bacterium]|nr:WbqC family protein [Pseudomonadota bacterium]